MSNFLTHPKLYMLLLWLFAGCSTANSQPVADMDQMQWLAGNWKGMFNNAPFYESWRKAGPTQLIQYQVKINKSDTLVTEGGRIDIIDKKATFSEGKFSWALTSLSPEEMVFTNPNINFPQTITWRKLANGHWYCMLKTNDQKLEYDIEPLPALEKAVNALIRKNKKP